ncbi:efflux RND transporter permease subunit [Kingella negevensis]|uniref:Efflux pump membrane transporter n=1 Tax=Kingella negevensis TaxID=1522312 RepID=A0A238T8S6_9NEIS|nr:efflux RND transporter permease subunit [Kingella negevensis]MDK4684684.1 efflux RND transporter permease subunit [Kingella negevensis]MDK4696590.1 efflux RND transporter permease subunit [Kingella negevensis]MDK4707385.1 efflux RND transporter permease subunit [Kingella negevensis]MDK4710138.1 efflux RND transporter permease subunit [Kingella negevensis]SNB54469.1 Multidrug efflux pump subunit AcrB [Kingella negevensis]
MPKFFIERPIFAWVIAIFIMIAGVIGISKLPISQYPSVASPTITLTATYPGASATVMEDSVLSVIERNMYGVEGLDYISTSADSSGSGSVTLTFKPDTNEDLAQMNVQNKLSEVNALLPATVQQNGVNVSKARSNFLMVVFLDSKTKSAEELLDYSQRNVVPELQRIEGVGNVRLFGAQRAMRVWIDPNKLKNYDLSFADVTSAISAQNAQLAVGSLGARPADIGQQISATITAEGQLQTAEEFGNILLKQNTSGANVYLKDVAEIALGSQSYASNSYLNGKTAAGMAVSLSTTGNAMATATAVKAKMEELKKYFPEDVTWSAPYDTSKFVELSIKKVVSTLFEAIVLVFIVMFIFLQNIRYTLIPTIVVPISLLGAFAAISYMGMSINVMTMFAMVLVIGIVVDDAIVVVENVERIMAEEGLLPKQATKKAMKQISGAVVGITAVLVSVFVPLSMLSGASGNIYRQFSLTMVFAILFSAFLALTLTPALCATMLKPIPKGHNHVKKGFFGWFNRKFNAGTRRYSGWIASTLRKAGATFIVYAALTAAAFVLVMRLPTAFLPSEDQGNLMVTVQLPSGATHERTEKTLASVVGVAKSLPEVENVITVSGFSFSGSGQNMGLGFIILKDWTERAKPGSDAASVAGKITGALMSGAVKDGFALAINPPPIMELGNDSGFGLYLQQRGSANHEELVARRDELIAKMRANPQIFNASNVRASGLEDASQLKLDIDRMKAASNGVSFASIRTVLGTALGSTYVNDFPNDGRLQRVIVQADAKSRMQPEDILALTVPASDGTLIPLSSFMTAKWEKGIEQSVRFNGYPAMQLTGAPAAGKTTGEAMAEVQRMVDELEGNYALEWSGQSREEAKGSSQQAMVLGLAAVAVLLALAALYESWSIPLAVVLVVPLGLLGVASGALLHASSRDLYFMIGMVTVMGLSAKNAILIIEFAKDLQKTGKTAAEAALRAAKLRFRPILMTSFAFILGVVPMYIATGASAASQHAIGTAVFWGMLVGTFLSVFLVPMFYVVVRKFFKGKPVPEQGELDLFDDEEDMK